MALSYGGGPGIIASAYMSVFVFMIFIVLFVLTIIIDSIRRPNTKVATLALIAIFCFLIVTKKVLFVFLSVFCTLVLLIINKQKNNYNLKTF